MAGTSPPSGVDMKKGGAIPPFPRTSSPRDNEQAILVKTSLLLLLLLSHLSSLSANIEISRASSLVM